MKQIGFLVRPALTKRKGLRSYVFVALVGSLSSFLCMWCSCDIKLGFFAWIWFEHQTEPVYYILAGASFIVLVFIFLATFILLH